MCRCENWNIKKAECQRIDAFELWCWRRLLRVPWTVRRSNQPIPKEVNPEYSLEGLMLKLKLQYFGHLLWRDDSLEKTLMLQKFWRQRRRGRQRRWLDIMTDSMDMNLSKLWETVKDREAWYAAVSEVAKNQTQLSDWTTTSVYISIYSSPIYHKLFNFIVFWWIWVFTLSCFQNLSVCSSIFSHFSFMWYQIDANLHFLPSHSWLIFMFIFLIHLKMSLVSDMKQEFSYFLQLLANCSNTTYLIIISLSTDLKH